MAGLLPVRSISEIKEGDTRWQAHVLVLDKTNAHTGRGGGHRLQKCLLADSQGTIIEAILWDEMIERYSDSLEPFKTYIVQGAKVKKIKEHYLHWAAGATLEWSMTKHTVVEFLPNPEPTINYPVFHGTPLSLTQTMNPNSDPFDVIAAVVTVEPPRQVQTADGPTLLQDLQLVDESLALTPFTMWGEFLPNQGADLFEMQQTMPIILCRRLGISKHTGFPATTLSTYITVEPDIPEAVELRQWVSTNVATIRSLQPVTKTTEPMLLSASNAETDGLHNSSKAGNGQRFNISGQLRIQDVHQSIAYCICSECGKMLYAEMKKNVRCRNCNEINEALPSYKVAVVIQTAERSIHATMFESAAQKLLQQTPENIHRMSPQEVTNLLMKLNAKFQHKVIAAVLKTSPKKYANQKEMYAVHQWGEPEVTAISETEKTAAPTQGTKGTLQIAAYTSENETIISPSTAKTSDNYATAPFDIVTAEKATAIPETISFGTPITAASSSSVTTKSSPLSNAEKPHSVQLTKTPDKQETKRLKTTLHGNPVAAHENPVGTTETKSQPRDPRLLRKVKLEHATTN